MSALRRLAIVTLCIVLGSAAAGCWDLRPIEDLSILFALAVDLAPNGTDLMFTAIEPLFTQPRSADVKTTWAVAHSLGEALHLMQLEESKRVGAGKIFMYLFGEDLWKSGRVVEIARSAYVRNDFSLTGQVALVRGKAADALMIRPEENKITPVFLLGTINAARGLSLTPGVALFEVARQWPPLRDFWLPLLRVEKESNLIHFDGSVVFKGTVPQGELTQAETMDLAHVSGKYPGHSFEIGIPVPEGGNLCAAVTNSRLNKEFKKSADGGNVLSIVSDYSVALGSPVDLSTNPRPLLRDYTAAMSSELSGRGTQVLKKLQELDSDPLGLTAPGAFTSFAEAQQKRDAYKDAQLIYTARVKIDALSGQ